MRPIVAIAVGLALGCAAVNVLLSRIDHAAAEARAARSEVRLLRAQIIHRDLKPANTDDSAAYLHLTALRVETLRRTLSTLIAAGTRWPMFVSLPSLEATLWPSWPEHGWDLRVERMRIAGGEP